MQPICEKSVSPARMSAISWALSAGSSSPIASCAGSSGSGVRRTLTAKGVGYGSIAAERVSSGGSRCSGSSRRFRIETRGVRGVDADLVIRPLQWKGNTTTVHAVNRDGGEAANARNRAAALSVAQQAQRVAFIENLVLFKLPED